MEILGWLANGALLFSFGVAGGSLAVSFRSSEARTASRGMWLCVGAALSLVVLTVVAYLYAMSIVWAAVGVAHAASKATLLAQGMSEAMNCAALVVLGTLPVGLAALVLLVRAKRLARQS